MKKLLYILSFFVVVFWQRPSLALDLSAYNSLLDIKTFSSEKNIKLVVNFDKPIEKIIGPQFFEKSIQFVFDKTYIVPAKKSFNIGEELISDINAYQYDKNSVRLRLMIGEFGDQLEDRLTYETKGNKLVININKKGSDLMNTLFNEKTAISAVALEEEPDKQVESFLNENDLESLTPLVLDDTDLDKIDLKTDEMKKNMASDTGTPSLYSSFIRTAAALLVVLALMMLVYYFAKKYLLKEGSLLGMDKQIKVLSTSYIAPKKSISLVEVAGEVLVLGVTATNISMLSKIEDPEIAEKIKGNSSVKSPISSFSFGGRKSKQKKSKPITSAFSKQLDVYTSKTENNEKKDRTIKALNRLIQEKIDNLKMA